MNVRWVGVCLLATALVAQERSPETAPVAVEVQVRVLDGRNGSPVTDEQVSLWFDEVEGRPALLQTDARGVATVPMPRADVLRLFVAASLYVDCRKVRAGDPPVPYGMRQIMEFGVAAENGCGTVQFRKRPGELVLFVRPHRWFDGAKQ